MELRGEFSCQCNDTGAAHKRDSMVSVSQNDLAVRDHLHWEFHSFYHPLHKTLRCEESRFRESAEYLWSLKRHRKCCGLRGLGNFLRGRRIMIRWTIVVALVGLVGDQCQAFGKRKG